MPAAESAPCRNLVIVRAGDKSLHPGWLAGDGPRNWDLVVSYFGKDPDLWRRPDVPRFDAVGPKWPPLQALLQAHPEWLERYDFIWLPDDDLEMSKRDMNRFFDLCREYGLELAQPAATPDSPMTHPLLMRNSATRLRFTNFVEVMAPCFSASLLRRALPTLNETQSGWGIDWLWPRLVDNPRRGIAVIDEVVMRHTRPVGGPNYDALRARGISPTDELLAFERRHGISKVRVEVHGAVWRAPWMAPMEARSARFRLMLLLGHSPAVLRSPARRKLLKQALGRARRPHVAA